MTPILILTSVLALCLVLSVLVWMWLSSSPASVPGPLVLTDKDNGRDVEIPPGQEARLVFSSNPTTGYSWRTLEIKGESVRVESDWSYSPSTPVRIGSGGSSSLVLRATRSGATTVYLVHDSPFAPSSDPTFHIRFIVT